MRMVHAIPLYWVVETEPVDRTFITRASLHEILPPFRQSNLALRIRVSPKHWLHVGLFHYDTNARRYGLDYTANDIGKWGLDAVSEEELDDGEDAADDEVCPAVERGPVPGVGDRPF